MNVRRLIVLVVLAGVGCGAGARAGTVAYTATGGFSLLGGTDTFGLVGASFTFTATFSDTAVYSNLLGQPAVAALGDSLTIAGASVAGVDGTYQESFGISFRPTVLGQFFGGSNQTTFARWTVLGQPLTLGNLTQPMPPSPIIGGVIAPADLSPIPAPTYHLFYTNDADYLITNLQVSVTTSAVPEPPSLVLAFLAGAVAAGVAASRR